MKALVTGATGFVGSHLVSELKKRGYDVTCLVRNTSSLKWIEGLDVDIFCGDCTDRESLGRLPEGFHYIFHLAGLTKARKKEEFFDVNARGTEHLLGALEGATGSIKRFVYLSSLAAVGPSLNGTPVNESTQPHPVSDYGRSKLEGELIVLRYKDKIPVTIIRPPAVYGPRDRDFYVFFKLLKRGIFPYLGRCSYSLLYVDDLVRGVIDAAESDKTAGGVFFLSDGNIYTNEEIADMIASAFNKKPIRLRIPGAAVPVICGLAGKFSGKASIINRDKLREMSYPNWICDSSSAQRGFGFTPKIKIKEGIRWTADWYRIHQWL